MKNVFEKAFVTLRNDTAKISMDGKIAVRAANSKDYKVYDTNEKKLIDYTDFCIDLPNHSLLIIPVKTTDLSIGDIVYLGEDLVSENIYCIIDVKDDELTAINYTTGKKEIVLPQYFFFMKNTAYILKIVNLFGNMFSGFNQDNDMMKYFMMSKMMNGDGDGENKDLMPMMFMMNGGNFEDNDMMKYFMMSKMMDGKSNNLMPMMFMMNGGNFDFGNMFGGKKQTTTKSKK